jgi:4-hydroxythreonine-4-phosphate dehydrogenase
MPLELPKPPRIALTMGDPAGVGPEIIVAAWRKHAITSGCLPFVVGHPDVLRRALRLLGTPCEIQEIGSPSDAVASLDVIPCVKAVREDAVEVPPCQIDARGGQAAYDALRMATAMALKGDVDAVVTGPLHKAALWRAGHHYPGHTEILAELCGVSNFAMMLYLGPGEPLKSPHGLGVAHVTLHMALRDVFDHLSTDTVLAKIRLLHGFIGRMADAAPRIGVAALNPHAGEEGLFGREEIERIAPAVELARADGIEAQGPFPCDTLMVRARDGDFDGVVAMYHDQGHIAVKLLGMHRAVNVTLGLPIIRTSVAHGTAFDLAWKGLAETTGLAEAVKVAARLARARQSQDAEKES